ncbi:MAG: hypothetical protein Q9163_002456 [Psora crenata]
MPEQQQNQELLLSILEVLQRIETKITKNGGTSRRPEDAIVTGTTVCRHTEQVDQLMQEYKGSERKQEHAEVPQQESPIPESTQQSLKVYYGEWSVDHFIMSLPDNAYVDWSTSSRTHVEAPTPVEEFFDQRISQDIERRLGDCWNIPDDYRIALRFFKSSIFKTTFPWGTSSRSLLRAKQAYEQELGFLCSFDEELRKQAGNDFVVLDFDAVNNTRIYRVGEKAIGPELMVDFGERRDAPWSRIMYVRTGIEDVSAYLISHSLYQGATTGGSIGRRKRPEQPIPYFSRTNNLFGIWDHISSHLKLKRRSSIANPYRTSAWTGFHTTFYEICEDARSLEKELWKHGPLYDHPLGWHFRKCAYTLYSPVGMSSGDPDVVLRRDDVRHWTILILAPNGFFSDTNKSFSLRHLDVGVSQALGHSMGRMSKLGAELNLIGHGLEQISHRWADFQSYFDYILDGADSLMNPAEHDKLLFDDGAFSRSRKYFWAIDCLSEFDISISDNLVQWEYYRDATVSPIILDSLSPIEQRQLAYADMQYRTLQAQRESFRQKLSAIRGLRDALFNASAVIESRASTRLGENVKLLTFVSIFFLPLAFITSLWSINDKFSTSALIYVILIVALATYLVMFNINSLVQGLGRLYNMQKTRLVHAMKNDRKDLWKLRGQRFEVFRPKHENPEPSEWYIPLYALMHPGVILGVNGFTARNPSIPQNSRAEDPPTFHQLAKLRGLLRKRKRADREGKEPEAGWVI